MKPTVTVLFLIFVLSIYINTLAVSILEQYSSKRFVAEVIKSDDNLWIATSGGIVKFNESQKSFTTFNNLQDIPELYLSAAVRGESDEIWFGSINGYIILLNTKTTKFTWFNSLAASGIEIKTLHYFKKHLFVGTQKGLSIFSPSSGVVIANIEQFGSMRSEIVEIASYVNKVAVLTLDGVAEFSVDDFRKVNFYDPSILKLTYTNGIQGIAFENGELRLYRLKTKYTNSHICEYGRIDVLDSTGKIIDITYKLIIDKKDTIPSAVPFTCVTESGEYIVFGTKGNGIHYLNLRSFSIIPVTIPGPLDIDIRSCFVANDQTVWYVTDNISNGIGMFVEPNIWGYINDQTNPSIGPLIVGREKSNNKITITSNGDIWVASWAHGIRWYNQEKRKWIYLQDSMFIYTTGIDAPIEPSPLVRFAANPAYWWTLTTSVCQDSFGLIWIGNCQAYNGQFIHILNPRNGQWRSLSKDEYGFPSTMVGCLTATKKNNIFYIYVGYYPEGDATANGFSVISYDANPLTSTLRVQNSIEKFATNDIEIDGKLNVWMATSKGLYKIPSNEIMRTVQIELLANRLLNSVKIDPENNPVISFNGDLYIYRESPTDTTLLNLTKNIGIEPNRLGNVYDIQYDQYRKSFWICSDKGLFKYKASFYESGVDLSSTIIYPNPVSISRHRRGVTIDKVAKNSKIIISDIHGNTVATLFNNKLSGLEQTFVVWNCNNSAGRNVVPGTYYCSISAENNYIRKKIVVIP